MSIGGSLEDVVVRTDSRRVQALCAGLRGQSVFVARQGLADGRVGLEQLCGASAAPFGRGGSLRRVAWCSDLEEPSSCWEAASEAVLRRLERLWRQSARVVLTAGAAADGAGRGMGFGEVLRLSGASDEFHLRPMPPNEVSRDTP